MSELHPDSDVLSLNEAIAVVRAGLNAIDPDDPIDIPSLRGFMAATEQVVSALQFRLDQEIAA